MAAYKPFRAVAVMVALVLPGLAGLICGSPASAQGIWIDDFNGTAGPVSTPPGFNQLPPPLGDWSWARWDHPAAMPGGYAFSGQDTRDYGWTASIGGGSFKVKTDDYFVGNAIAVKAIQLAAPAQQLTLEMSARQYRLDGFIVSSYLVAALYATVADALSDLATGWVTTGQTHSPILAAIPPYSVCFSCPVPGPFVTVSASVTLPAPRKDFVLVLFGYDGHNWCTCEGSRWNFEFDYVKISYVPSQIQVAIDIKPGDYPNSINLRSQGKIPVAILSSPTFNAPAQVDRNSLTFGRTGDETSLVSGSSTTQDVNGDGRPDLVCYFLTQRTGFQAGGTQGVLKGKTIGGISIVGIDSVRIIP